MLVLLLLNRSARTYKGIDINSIEGIARLRSYRCPHAIIIPARTDGPTLRNLVREELHAQGTNTETAWKD